MSVGDDSWDRGVCWEKLGIVLTSGERGVCNLMEIVGTSKSVVDILLRLQSGGIDHSAKAGAAATGSKNLPGTNAC